MRINTGLETAPNKGAFGAAVFTAAGIIPDLALRVRLSFGERVEVRAQFVLLATVMKRISPSSGHEVLKGPVSSRDRRGKPQHYLPPKNFLKD